MLFDYDILVPAQTPTTNHVRQVCQLTSGLLQEIRVKFPPGPATLVHIIVLDSLYQLLPANPGGDINIDDDMIISANLRYKLSSPYEVFIEGWSPNATYEHTITCQFDVQPDTNDPFETFAKLLMTDSQPKRKR